MACIAACFSVELILTCVVLMLMLLLLLPPRYAMATGVGVSDDPGALYNSMHAYLASSAVDGVKVDCQVSRRRSVCVCWTYQQAANVMCLCGAVQGLCFLSIDTSHHAWKLSKPMRR